ncbi:hypothetical protein LTS10_005946 [Elasticomyces elasticus]|nr:hypothetical protein LTS10_005946 [Elasticomyces elasticus]
MKETVVYNLDDELARTEDWEGDTDTLDALVDRDLEVVSALCLSLLKHNQLEQYWRRRFDTYLSFTSGEDAEKRLDEAS